MTLREKSGKKSFKSLTATFTPEQREKVEAAKERLRGEMSLAELREALDPDFLHELIANEIERNGATYLGVRNAALKITELVASALPPPGEAQRVDMGEVQP